jgi:hypothetical protein
VRTLTIKYDTLKQANADEDLRLKGLAFDRLDSYFKKIIQNDGASGILAALNLDYKIRLEAGEDLVYKLSEHFRQKLNSVYKDELENS